MTFADEVKASRSPEPVELPTQAVAAPEAAPEVAPPQHGEVFNEGLPQAPKEAPAEPKKEAPPEAPKQASPIKIGKQEFQTLEQAIEYAKELERAAAEDKAYIEGMKDAQKQQSPARLLK